MASVRMNHYYSNEWCRDEHARTQEQLQEIARQIRENCKVEEIAQTACCNEAGNVCTIYTNKNLGLKYWVKDTFGHISEIDEAREY